MTEPRITISKAELIEALMAKPKEVYSDCCECNIVDDINVFIADRIEGLFEKEVYGDHPDLRHGLPEIKKRNEALRKQCAEIEK